MDGRRVLAAVDITFRDEAGSQVEPLCDVTFTLRSEALLLADELEVVHVDTLEDGAVDPGSAPQKLASSSTADDAVLVQTDSFSIFAVVDADSAARPLPSGIGMKKHPLFPAHGEPRAGRRRETLCLFPDHVSR